jgi:hypothetical protein
MIIGLGLPKWCTGRERKTAQPPASKKDQDAIGGSAFINRSSKHTGTNIGIRSSLKLNSNLIGR